MLLPMVGMTGNLAVTIKATHMMPPRRHNIIMLEGRPDASSTEHDCTSVMETP